MLHRTRTTLIAAKSMLAKLTPLKPIMCVVVSHHNPSLYGLAVSDAYLGSARPLPAVAGLHDLEHAVEQVDGGIGGLLLGLPLVRNQNNPSSSPSFDYENHSLLSSSLSHQNNNNVDLHAAENMREGLYYKLLHDDRLNERVPFLSPIENDDTNDYDRNINNNNKTSDDLFTLSQAQKLAQEQMELWEDIDLDDTSPSTDAAVALNNFLWKHTGGWRNTFG